MEWEVVVRIKREGVYNLTSYMLPGAQAFVHSAGIPFLPIPEPRRAETCNQVCPKLA